MRKELPRHPHTTIIFHYLLAWKSKSVFLLNTENNLEQPETTEEQAKNKNKNKIEEKEELVSYLVILPEMTKLNPQMTKLT